MGRCLTLVVPEPDRSRDCISEYYDFQINKSRQFDHPEIDFTAYLKRSKNNELKRFEESGKFHISENVARDFRTSSAWERLRALSETDERDYQLRLVEGDELDTMIELFREIKADMKAEQGGPTHSDARQKWEVEIELAQVAMCEFARDHGYGVKLTH